ncbi:MAG: hypothetical protein JW814_10390 [Candidatus Krumholzibacteriota bacterium]|nr:hypothetical protein [Candidatus Krumholzibacteriota bacterium]
MSQKTCTIQDRSLENAMKKAKDQFGPDVLIVNTRERRGKKEGGLGIDRIFEVTVAAEDDAGLYARSDIKPKEELLSRSEAAARLEKQIERLEKLEISINRIEGKIRGMLEGHSTYPIFDLLSGGGVSPRTVEMIADSFSRTGKKGRDPEGSAFEHLERHLRVAEERSCADMSGIHYFFGTGGSGKTSIIIKLAAKLVDLGKDVSIITLFPRHGGEVKRLEVVGKTLAIGTYPVHDLQGLRETLDSMDEETVVLVDTPCVATVSELRTERFASFISEFDFVNRHYVFDISKRASFLRQEVEVFDRLGCDFCVLTKLDLSLEKAAFIDLIATALRPFSFINESPDFDRGFDIATRKRLLDLVKSCKRSVREEERDISVNKKTGSSEDTGEEDKPKKEDSTYSSIEEEEPVLI